MAEKVCERYEDLLVPYPLGASKTEMAKYDAGEQGAGQVLPVAALPAEEPVRVLGARSPIRRSSRRCRRRSWPKQSAARARGRREGAFPRRRRDPPRQQLHRPARRQERGDARVRRHREGQGRSSGHPRPDRAPRSSKRRSTRCRSTTRTTELYEQVYLVLKDEGTVHHRGRQDADEDQPRSTRGRSRRSTERLVEQARRSQRSPAPAQGAELARAGARRIDRGPHLADRHRGPRSRGGRAGRDHAPTTCGRCRPSTVAAMLEEMKFFAIADKVAEQFTVGMMPITRGAGGEYIYQYIESAPDRITEVERREPLRARLRPGAGPVEEPMPNREFTDLWIRFLSAVEPRSREKRDRRSSSACHRAGAQDGARPGRQPVAARLRHGALRGGRAAEPDQVRQADAVARRSC